MREACADLPPLLQFADGRPVVTSRDWPRRASEIRKLMCEYFIGTFPETLPAILRSETLSESQIGETIRRMVRIVLNTPSQVAFELEIWIPRDGPSPILLTQPNADQLKWANMAAARGYLVCLYPGLDRGNQEQDYPNFDSIWHLIRAEYPKATWTEISTKAWLASRAIDYLLNPANGYSVVKEQIAIIGHSRYGKQSLIAAAFDERITSVVAVSPGSPHPARIGSRPETLSWKRRRIFPAMVSRA